MTTKQDNVFPKKYMSKVSDDFKNTADSMSEDELKKKIVEFEKAISFTENELETDPDVNSLKEQLKHAQKDMKEEIAMLTANIKYSVFILNSRGTV